MTINGEEILVDAVKDPRIARMGQWHTRGVYKWKYVVAKGRNLGAADRRGIRTNPIGR